MSKALQKTLEKRIHRHKQHQGHKMTKHIEKKVELKPCRQKKHTFIPISWRVSQASKVASIFMCQHCLLNVERADIEYMNQVTKKEMDKQDEKNEPSKV